MIRAAGLASEEHVARFYAEARAVAALQHVNIVQIHDIGESETLPYFSLEFVPGSSLDKKLAKQPQPPLEAAAMVETLARAMHYAHQHGIVHRDLKP
ncbi:MAG: protein kinase domain-containing protein, partial [bacterium]